MKQKLTVRTINALSPSEKDVIVWDTELTGFCVKVTPRGRKTFYLYYRNKAGDQRRPSIGVHGSIQPEAAREIAKRWLLEIAQGGDPSLNREQHRKAPNVAELCERYLSDHAEVRKKASSIAGDRQLIRLYVVPKLGSRKVGSVTRTEVAALHHSLRGTPYMANRVLALTSKMFALAERWNLRPDGSNPAKNVDRFREQKRERFLSAGEVGKLWVALSAPDLGVSSSALSAIKLLMLTGRRLNEILQLKWSYIDLDTRTLRLPDTKTGSLLVPLSGTAVSLLADMKASAGECEYVIEGQRAGQPLVNLQKPWRLIRSRVGLDDVRLHDLRHSYASMGAGLGMSLPMIGRILGHSNSATTARYAHLATDPVRAAIDAIDVAFGQMATSQPLRSNGELPS